MTIQEALNLGLRHHHAGRLAEAEGIYRGILAQHPNQPDVLHLLGLIAQRAGQRDAAMQLISQAIGVSPNQAEFHGSLGLLLEELGRTDEAISAYRRTLALNPNLPQAHNNLANALAARGEADQASSHLRQAMALAPDYADPPFNLANILRVQGRADEAVELYRLALWLRPNWPEAHNNLGVAQKNRGEVEWAIASFKRAVELSPDYAAALSNLGDALYAAREYEQAAAACRRALQLRPDVPEPYNNLGNALCELGRLDEGTAAYRQALNLRPDYLEALGNLATVSIGVGESDEAVALYDRALALRPDAANASNRLFILQFQPRYDSQGLLREHRLWNDRYAQPLAKSARPHENDRSPDRRLRVGYVSPDFRDHVLSRNLLPLLLEHDQEQFAVHCYSSVKRPDGMTRLMRDHAAVWRDITRIGDAAAAELIRADQTDILVDLGLHSALNRLLIFARKPAPVQITFAGYPGTTGLAAMDWRLTDPRLDPDGVTDQDYAERSFRLPDSFWCYDPRAMQWEEDAQAIPLDVSNSLPAEKNGHVTFGCLNHFCKVNEGVLKLWSRVLQAAPGSRLRMLAPEGQSRRRVLQSLQSLGVESGRVDFVDRQARRAYLSEFLKVDVCLDTFPYNGHTTSLDSLWMGAPVVSRVGRTVVGRAGVSQSHTLGLLELAAYDDDQFVKVATELSGDLTRLGELRRTLRQRMLDSPLTDARRWTRNVEAAYRRIWRLACA